MTIQRMGTVTGAFMKNDTTAEVIIEIDRRELRFDIPIDQARNWVVGNAVHLTAYSYSPPPDHATSA